MRAREHPSSTRTSTPRVPRATCRAPGPFGRTPAPARPAPEIATPATPSTDRGQVVIPTPARLLERLHATGCARRLRECDPAVIQAVREGIGISLGDPDRERAETRGETGAACAAPEAPPRGGAVLLPLVLTAAVIAAPGVL